MTLPENYTWQSKWDGNGGCTFQIVTKEEAERYRQQLKNDAMPWYWFVLMLFAVFVGIPAFCIIVL